MGKILTQAEIERMRKEITSVDWNGIVDTMLIEAMERRRQKQIGRIIEALKDKASKKAIDE